jgi:NTE family protein
MKKNINRRRPIIMKSLVLSGGGSFGAFEAGVLYSIFNKIKFDKIYGTSVGALNSILMAQAYLDGKPDILKETWTNIINKNNDVYNKSILKIILGRPPYNYSPLRKFFKKNIDIKSILKMDKKINLTACDLISGLPITFSNQNGLTENQFIDAAIGSASVPPLFPPVKLKKFILVDGGIRDNVPLVNVIDNKEKDSVLVIMCRDEMMEERTDNYNGILNIGERVIDIMMNEITKNDISMVLNINDLLEKIEKEAMTSWLMDKKHINIDIIYPEENLKGDMLDFSGKHLTKLFEKGMLKGLYFLEFKSSNLPAPKC